MATDILTGQGNQLTGKVSSEKSIIKISIGGSNPATMYLLDRAGTNQPFRTQYDMAIDGTAYLVGAGRGAGDYEFKVLDGPFCTSEKKTENVSMLAKITEFDNISARTIKIVMPTGNSVSDKTFSGVINSISTYHFRTDDGQLYYISSVGASGIWS